MGARFYEPGLGRWLSEDPMQDKHFEPSTLNFYAYVNNNPILLINPTGESLQEAVREWLKKGEEFAKSMLKEVYANMVEAYSFLEKQMGITQDMLVLGVISSIALAMTLNPSQDTDFGKLVADYRRNPGNWRVAYAWTEASRRYKGGSSTRFIYQRVSDGAAIGYQFNAVGHRIVHQHFAEGTLEKLLKWAFQIAVAKPQRVNVVDRLILTGLEFGFMPFDGIEKLLNDESFIPKEWFPRLSFSRERITSALLRLIQAGFVECRADSRVDGPLVARPSSARMIEYWYSPTLIGEAVLEHTAPWDLELGQCQLPDEASSEQEMIRAFRDDPESWEYEMVSASRDPTRTLVGWTSYHGALLDKEWGKLATHVVQLTQSRPPHVLQAHFRFLERLGELSEERSGVEDSKAEGFKHHNTVLDLLVLEILAADLESLHLITHILTHNASLYGVWKPRNGLSIRDVQRSILKAINVGHVEPYRESTERMLVPQRAIRNLFNAASIWFRITAKGKQALERGWLSTFVDKG